MQLELDQKSLHKLLDRFEKAPKKFQKRASGVALTAGAKVVIKAAKSKAPTCLRKTIKATRRKTSGLTSRLMVVAGSGNRPFDTLSGAERTAARDAGATSLTNCYPAVWVEFGTYGNRDYRGTEPYAPATLRKRSYSSGRSDSPYWNTPRRWVAARPFMRPAIAAPGVEQAMAKRLDEYLTKGGF